MKKLVKMICIMLTFICMMQTQMIMASSTADTTWPSGPKASSIVADSAIIMEASTGLILYGKNIDKQQYPASITKIMTALLVVENASLDEVVTFSRNAVYGIEPGSSHIAVEVDEQLTIEQCLYAIMLESANEVCLGVAEHISGSVEAFVDLMNVRAKELGCTNTNFVNPNGLHDDEHYVSAHDMALIAQAAIQNEIFRTVTGTKQYTIPETNKKEPRTWIKNHNQMLYGYKYPKYQYDYCIGGKTGYTTKAQSTLVTYAEKDGVTLICVVLKDLGPSYPKNQYTDTTSLFNYCFDNFSLYKISSEHESSKEVSSSLFTKYSALLNDDNPLIYLSDNTNVVLPNGVSIDDVEQNITYNNLSSFQEGENTIGTITYTYQDKVLGTGDIIYNIKDLTQLTTKTEVSVNADLVPINQGSSRSVNVVAIIIAVVVVGGGIIYYAFIVRKRRLRSAYYRRRRDNYYSKKYPYDDL